jgi:8-oxo-dGTP diphosphatase
MKILKAGCILLDLNNNKVGLVYRRKHNDFSFPKGHLEKGETLEECAIRETEEETGRI